MFKCLLSNFKNNLITLITVIVKYYVHVCKWICQIPTVSGVLKEIIKFHNIHHKKCLVHRNIRYYTQLWDLLANDLIMDRIVKTWEEIENE